MLKKIKVSEACLGMYIHKMCGKWMDHPFWKSSFLMSGQADLEKLRNSSVSEILIDTDKGLDVPVPESEPVKAKPKPKPKPPVQPAPVSKKNEKVPLEQELQVAKKLHRKTKQAVKSMFDEARMGGTVHVEEAVELVDEITESMSRNADAMLNLSRLKNADEYTYLHSVSVCVLMIALGKQLGLSGGKLKKAGEAGLFHDIGKMAIPGEVLNKPGKLTDEEFSLVKQHPQRGWEMLQPFFEKNDPVLDVCLHHHERMDGTGYPDKLSEENMTLFARMGAVCDVYDAITSDRCYKKGWEPAETITKMASWCNDHFDETVFRAFVKTVGIYPNGTVLKLKSGRLGIVIEQSEKDLTEPLIKVFFSTRINEHIPPEIIDLSKSRDKAVGIENMQQLELDISKIIDEYKS